MQLVRLKSRYVKAVGVSAHCVLRITSWQAVLKAACGCSAYCVLRIATWRALPNAACGRPAYSAPVLRILLWAVLTTACVLRTAYSYCVWKLCAGLRTAYCASVLRSETVWGALRTAYCVSVLRIGGLGCVAYCVLRIRTPYWRFEAGLASLEARYRGQGK